MRAIVFPVLCVCAVLTVPVSASAQKSRTCAPSVIRAAAAKQVAPNLVGCRYDEVAVPLVRYFSIFPVLTKTPGREATSTILEQWPAAGDPLAAGGQLALNVSVGRAAQPAVVPAKTVLEAEPVEGDRASGAPVEIMTFVATSAAASPAQAAPAPSPSIRLPSLDYLLRPGLLWGWLGLALALALAVISVALTFRGKRRRPEYGYDRVPKVTARFEYAPSRLSAYGPLIVGRGGAE